MIKTIREQVEIWEAFQGLPDEAVVRSDLAAVFLGISTKTLARLRQNGEGPAYIQISETGSSARNQIVNYVMGKLRAYRANKEVSSSMNAAQMRGLAFNTIEDLIAEQPYLQQTFFGSRRSQTKIIGHIQTISDDEFKSALTNQNAEVVWLTAQEALDEIWTNAEARKLFHDEYVQLLNNWINRSEAGQERTELHQI